MQQNSIIDIEDSDLALFSFSYRIRVNHTKKALYSKVEDSSGISIDL